MVFLAYALVASNAVLPIANCPVVVRSFRTLSLLKKDSFALGMGIYEILPRTIDRN
jgi:hypothetical protein